MMLVNQMHYLLVHWEPLFKRQTKVHYRYRPLLPEPYDSRQHTRSSQMRTKQTTETERLA
jgi:hypothetical protein